VGPRDWHAALATGPTAMGLVHVSVRVRGKRGRKPWKTVPHMLGCGVACISSPSSNCDCSRGVGGVAQYILCYVPKLFYVFLFYRPPDYSHQVLGEEGAHITAETTYRGATVGPGCRRSDCSGGVGLRTWNISLPSFSKYQPPTAVTKYWEGLTSYYAANK
jgi:hypothetical protein